MADGTNSFQRTGARTKSRQAIAGPGSRKGAGRQDHDGVLSADLAVAARIDARGPTGWSGPVDPGREIGCSDIPTRRAQFISAIPQKRRRDLRVSTADSSRQAD